MSSKTVREYFTQDLSHEEKKSYLEYINGNKTQETIDIVEDLLVKAEKSEFETKQFADYKDQFQWFIGFALLFLVIDVLLLEKKTKWVQKLNLFNQTEKNEK